MRTKHPIRTFRHVKGLLRLLTVEQKRNHIRAIQRRFCGISWLLRDEGSQNDGNLPQRGQRRYHQLVESWPLLFFSTVWKTEKDHRRVLYCVIGQISRRIVEKTLPVGVEKSGVPFVRHCATNWCPPSALFFGFHSLRLASLPKHEKITAEKKFSSSNEVIAETEGFFQAWKNLAFWSA